MKKDHQKKPTYLLLTIAESPSLLPHVAHNVLHLHILLERVVSKETYEYGKRPKKETYLRTIDKKSIATAARRPRRVAPAHTAEANQG